MTQSQKSARRGNLPRPGLLCGVMLLLAGAATAQVELPSDLAFNGDFRLRFESTSKQEPGGQPDIMDPRYRQVVRFRAGVSKQMNSLLKFGARLATGAQDDPNTADVTLGNFVDDLVISLDRLFVELNHEGIYLAGGKFANPFLRTDLVWDGDVNPQGVAAGYAPPGAGPVIPKLTGMYSIVDEQTQNPDSYMWGGQAQLGIQSGGDIGLRLAVGYYDYTIKSLTHADAGDTRSNLLNTAGNAYVSDFNLLDIIAVFEHNGLSEQFPLRVIGDFVKNTGAEVDADQGFGFDVFLGKTSATGDMRFRYGYSALDTDAVLAAFSNDNTTIATNYRQHTISFDFVAHATTTLNLTWYLYKRKDVSPETENDYFSRLRLNTVLKL